MWNSVSFLFFRNFLLFQFGFCSSILCNKKKKIFIFCFVLQNYHRCEMIHENKLHEPFFHLWTDIIRQHECFTLQIPKNRIEFWIGVCWLVCQSAWWCLLFLTKKKIKWNIFSCQMAKSYLQLNLSLNSWKLHQIPETNVIQ